MTDHRPHVTIELTAAEAMVLFDWLARTSTANEPAPFVDQAEQQVLWNVECALERVLVEPLSPDYTSLLASSRNAVRDGRG